MKSKIIHLSVSEDEVLACLNLTQALHELGYDSAGEPELVSKLFDKISDAYYNG